MTTARRKKMIEVALPLEAINKASAREKSIRHGHPSTLHLWWARRPLAACRAVLFSSLVDDPDDDPELAAMPDPDTRDNMIGTRRQKLFDLIEELVQWENSNNPSVINRAQAEIARSVATGKVVDDGMKRYDPLDDCHGAAPDDFIRLTATPEQVNAFLATHAPPVLDPFAGGGSIPLEAQRLGLRAHASDLNPVAVLINKALIEIPPKFAGRPPVHPQAEKRTEWPGATGLAEDVRRYGQWMRDEAEKRIGHLYPKVAVTAEMAKDRGDLKPYVGRELTVIAWLWARTVPSPDPALEGKHVPLVKSFWLSKKKGKEAWVKPVIDRVAGSYRFTVETSKPTGEDATLVESGTKTGRGCKFRCLISNATIPELDIKTAGKAGEMDATLMAVVCEGNRGRVYLPPTPQMEEVARSADPGDISGINAPLADDPRNLWCLGYGLDTFDKLFTQRQLTALVTFSDLVGEARAKVRAGAEAAGGGGNPAGLPDDPRPLHQAGQGPHAYADAVATYLAFGISKIADYNCSLVTWILQRDQAGHAMTKQAIPMVWDFAEVNPLVGAAGDITVSLKSITKQIASATAGPPGTAEQASATTLNGQLHGSIVSTDPPYYDNIGYADLSDFFYIWMRRSLGSVFPAPLGTMLTPKSDELIASPYRHHGSKSAASKFFEEGLGQAIGHWRENGNGAFPMTIFYAFKQEETDTEGTASTGWETFLDGVVKHGYAITATWPMRTERSVRSVAIGTNALASSIVLACVPRAADAAVATRGEFVAALRGELPEAIRTMQAGSIAPVDLAQASIGPGMAVFSRYRRVENADGSTMTVREALQLINATLDEALSEQEADFDADTRWAIKWFEQHGLAEGPYGDAETFSKAMNVSVRGLAEAGIVKSGQGKVRLLKREELPIDWDPAADNRLTVWETTQHLIHKLEHDGEAGAARLLAKLGSTAGENARELAYRLFQTCERKKRAKEAGSYNGLVVAWPEVVRLSREAAKAIDKGEQSEMFR